MAGSERGWTMRRLTCPDCGEQVAASASGRLRPHGGARGERSCGERVPPWPRFPRQRQWDAVTGRAEQGASAAERVRNGAALANAVAAKH